MRVTKIKRKLFRGEIWSDCILFNTFHNNYETWQENIQQHFWKLQHGRSPNLAFSKSLNTYQKPHNFPKTFQETYKTAEKIHYPYGRQGSLNSNIYPCCRGRQQCGLWQNCRDLPAVSNDTDNSRLQFLVPIMFGKLLFIYTMPRGRKVERGSTNENLGERQDFIAYSCCWFMSHEGDR